MGSVLTALSISLDGYVGGLGEQSWPVHERLLGWKFDLASFRAQIGMPGGEASVSSTIAGEEFTRSGAYVMGRLMFDYGEEPWGETPPFHAPVFVLTHRAREPLVRKGGTTFTFVTDGIASAIRQARAVAGEKDVFISGGASAVQQAIQARLLDELQVHVAPVILGSGVPLFAHLGSTPIELECTRVVQSPKVLHLGFRITR